ncbi:hypothetical protein [Streptomyces sp. NPDC047042]
MGRLLVVRVDGHRGHLKILAQGAERLAPAPSRRLAVSAPRHLIGDPGRI